MTRKRRTLPLAVLTALALAPGCGLSYLAHVGYGQARILVGRVSIESRLEDERSTAAERRKLQLVLDVRRFGQKTIGLAEGESYTTVFDTGGEPAAWNLSASWPEAFVPYVWSFPVIGALPFKGYFTKDAAREEYAELRAMNLDVLFRPVAAYSTLGWFADPLFTPMLDSDETELANVVLHELAHATVFVESDADFNETLATFIGNEGAIEYFRQRGGEKDPGLLAARAAAHDDAVFGPEMSLLRASLDALYKSGVPRSELYWRKALMIRSFQERFVREIRPRLESDAYDWVPERALDNALILTLERYHGDLEVFERAHRRLGSDLRKTVAKLVEIAEEPDPRGALQTFAR